MIREIGSRRNGGCLRGHPGARSVDGLRSKVLPTTAGADTKQLARFQIEAQVAAALHHPHIVPIFAVGCDQGVHYYAMQLIEGRSLAALLREERPNHEGDSTESGREPSSPLAAREAARLAIQAAEALEHAHALSACSTAISSRPICWSNRTAISG